METPRLWYIRGLDLFAGKPELLDRIREEGRLERWGHRASIAHREEPGEIHIVVSGGVELRDPVYEHTLKLDSGGLFGVTSSDAPPTQLLALDDTLIAALPRPVFDELAGRSLGLLEAQVGIVRRHRLAVPVSLLLYTTPRPRVAAALLHLVEEYGVVESETANLGVVPKPRTLARLTGLADRTVSDIFDALAKERVVEVGSTQLVIPDLERIRSLARGDSP